jgi:zinc protease
MVLRQRSMISIVLVGTVLAGCGPVASEVSRGSTRPVGVGTIDLTSFGDEFPTDQAVKIDKLDNGLTYYIRENDRPGNSVEMRLVINAGSAQESPDQSGVAHFLEHMMFNGTSKYPANELVDVLQGFGSEFGADINAYTSYDETVYQLTLPTDDPTTVETGIDVLHEWLTSATLTTGLVLGERGVVLDEWRQSSQSFDGRAQAASAGLVLGPTPYDGRSPIGTDTAISEMLAEPLRSFYDDWYRPDNAALVIVGSVDSDEIEAIIRGTFPDAVSRGSSPTRAEISIDSYTTPTVMTLVDTEVSQPLIELSIPSGHSGSNRISEARVDLLNSIALDVIINRLADDEKSGDTPFSAAKLSGTSWVRALDTSSILVTSNLGAAAESFDALAIEIERVLRFGLTEREVQRALASYQTVARDAYEARTSTSDGEFAYRYLSNFLAGKPIPNATDEHEILLAIFETVTAQAVADAFTSRWESSAPQVLLVAPTGDAASLPSEERVLATWQELADQDIQPRVETAVSDSVLLRNPPAAVMEVSSKEIDGDPSWYVEPTLLTFPNGLRVYLNSSAVEDGSLSFQATSPGGTSLVADADVANALAMPGVATASGLGGLNAVELSEALAGASIEINPYIDSTSENLWGSASSSDLEPLFQAIYLLMTDAQFDDNAVNDLITQITPYIDDPLLNPEFAAQTALAEARFGTEPRMRLLPNAEGALALNGQDMKRIWNDRYGNASDWVFAFSGDFDDDQMIDLVRRYLGNLPSDGTTETWKDVEIDPPSSIVRRDVLAGSGDKAALTVQLNGESDGGLREYALAGLLQEVLTNRLTENVREALGASYSPSATSWISYDPDILVETTISVSGSAADIQRLSGVVQDNLDRLRTVGTGGDEWESALETTYQKFNSVSNDLIAGELIFDGTVPDFDLREALNTLDLLETITVEEFNDFVRRALPDDRYIEIRLRPA